eukprot:CAMPEP_0172869102 /NCGR_PEP_ID=MMETSP1075-20121228/88055_1 /TAXON_ID=2916 /ORGANISM="Ceratium fusus, Strain PA161109" /LENGTH=179 /DNA_ID=CAMNT_0013718911 /DNA_START=39 /DNA_END=578 /DNA_ORIENTATION=+
MSLAMKVAALCVFCFSVHGVTAATARTRIQLRLRVARNGNAPVPPYGLAVGAAPAPAPMASPAASPIASPVGSAVEPSLHPVHQAQWEHHERRMAESEHSLAKSTKQLTESKLEHAKAEHDLAHHEGDRPSVAEAAAKVDKLENTLSQHTQAVQAANDEMKEAKKDFKKAEAEAKTYKE